MLRVGQGVEELNNRMVKADARNAYKSKAQSLRKQVTQLLIQNLHLDDEIDLRTSSDRGKDYECSIIAYKHCPRGRVPGTTPNFSNTNTPPEIEEG
jgi:hypothetical protein